MIVDRSHCIIDGVLIEKIVKYETMRKYPFQVYILYNGIKVKKVYKKTDRFLKKPSVFVLNMEYVKKAEKKEKKL